MADHIRKQIRDAAVTALTGLTTSGARVYENRTHELQDANLPGLRIYTDSEEPRSAALGASRLLERDLDLVIEACSKKSSGMDDELDAMIKEVWIALAANQGIGGAKWVLPTRIEIDMEGEAEKDVGVARMTFQVRYYTTLGAPDVSL